MDEMFEPRKKEKLDKSFFKGFTFMFSIALLLIIGTSYSYEFFKVNRSGGTVSISTSEVSINVTGNGSINETLSKYVNTEGIQNGLSKEFTIANNNSNYGKVILKLERTSGLALTNLQYAIHVNNVITYVGSVPDSGILWDNIVMGNETDNIKVVLWVNNNYSGSDLSFTGTISSQVLRTHMLAAEVLSDVIDYENVLNQDNNYVSFNKELYRIVKIENGRLVICKNSDFDANAMLRTNSNKYNSTLTYQDNSIIYSHSTDGKNLYLAKTVDIKSGKGTQTSPFILENTRETFTDKKAIAYITYKDGTTNNTILIQPIYYNKTNYISYGSSDSPIYVWNDGTDAYDYGQVVNFSTDKILTGVKSETVYSRIVENVGTASYIASYDDIITQNPTFTTQDQVSTNATKQTVYYYTGNDAAANANVLFAGYCWQIIRTTDNGGVRMIYNGVAVNNQCETTRTATKGINGQNETTQSMSAATLFGRSYDYDLTTGEFTIEDSTGLPTSWSTSDNNSNGTEDYKELIGTYTCLSDSITCSTLYYVGSINESNTAQAYVLKYTIGDVAHFSQMGTSAFNPNYYSPAMVGYMFNTEYDYKSQTKSGEYYTTATWNGTTYDLTSGNEGTAPDVSHHYICDSDCTKVRYYYYSTSYYILLENGTTVEDAIYKMTGNGTVETNSKTINANYELNNYNSAMKGYLDNWYKKNLTGYTSFLDGTSVYCNDRSIRELGGWNPTNSPSLTTTLQFYQYIANRDLNCVNETDRFAVTNNKAELTYPIGLLTEPERNLMTANFAKTGQYYWGASPGSFYYVNDRVRRVNATGDPGNGNVRDSFGARGVVTLSPSTKLEDGTGTYTDPYVVGPLVTIATPTSTPTPSPTPTPTPTATAPSFTSVSGSITWDDNNNAGGTRPSYVTISLLQDGTEVGTRTVTESTGWSYTFTGLPIDDGAGHTYSYEIISSVISGYYTRFNGYNITATALTPIVPPDDPPAPPAPSG